MADFSVRVLLAREEVRFLIVGGINTVVGYALFVLLQTGGGHVIGYLGSLYLSYALAVTLAFVLHRRYTFRVTGALVTDFVRFVGVYVISLGLNTILLPLLVEVAHLPPLLAQAICVVITTIVSYVGHKWFSFRRGRPTTPES